MSEYGVIIGPRSVCFERVLPGPIERVWAYLTESEKRRKWLASGDMELRLGGRVELKFNHADLSANLEPTPERYKHEVGETFIGRITRCETAASPEFHLGHHDGWQFRGHLRADSPRQ